MKYYIIPKADWKEIVEANSEGEAIGKFATTMDMDMNIYFDVVSKKDYELYLLKRDIEESIRSRFIDFATDALIDDFEFDEEEVRDLAESAWDLYCGNTKGGEGLTQYKCIEKAVDDHKKENGSEEESW